MGVIAAVYGILCYLAFLASFLYSIGFVGDFLVPKTIDSPPSMGMPGSVGVDVVLLALFAFQHSIMARPGFKSAWTRVVPASVERSTYVLFSSLLLGLLFWKWQAIPTLVWDIQWWVLKVLLLVLFATGWLILLLATFMINHFDLFGLRQVYLRMRGQDYVGLEFTQRALYKVVRHPIMLGFLIAFWATPRMSTGHMIFAVATTGYILVGILLEEHDLMKSHGDTYGAYRARVPMLLPTGTKRR
jgi:methanethiol S-methyltransferase